MDCGAPVAAAAFARASMHARLYKRAENEQLLNR